MYKYLAFGIIVLGLFGIIWALKIQNERNMVNKDIIINNKNIEITNLHTTISNKNISITNLTTQLNYVNSILEENQKQIDNLSLNFYDQEQKIKQLQKIKSNLKYKLDNITNYALPKDNKEKVLTANEILKKELFMVK